jgi:hypothetical protein
MTGAYMSGTPRLLRREAPGDGRSGSNDVREDLVSTPHP